MSSEPPINPYFTTYYIQALTDLYQRNWIPGRPYNYHITIYEINLMDKYQNKPSHCLLDGGLNQFTSAENKVVVGPLPVNLYTQRI